MKRPSYSVYFVSSAIHKRHFVVPSRLHKFLIVWAETTPGLATYDLKDLSLSYIENGRPKRTVIPMTATLDDGVIQYRDFSRGGAATPPSVARSVKSAYAQHMGIEYVVLFEDDYYQRPIESRNRLYAHTILVHGAEVNTDVEEAAALMALHGRRMRLADLSTELGLTQAKTVLVYLRCWLKRRLDWQINDSPLSSHLVIGG